MINYRVFLSVPDSEESFFPAFYFLRHAFGWDLPETKTYIESVAGWYFPGVLMPLGVLCHDDVTRLVETIVTHSAHYDYPVLIDVYPVSGD